MQMALGSDRSSLSKMLYNFRREVLILGKLRHPNITTIFGAGENRDGIGRNLACLVAFALNNCAFEF
jgi:serine/threonine protein kinase